MDREVAELQAMLAKMTPEEQAEALAALRLGAMQTMIQKGEDCCPEEYSVTELEEHWNGSSGVSIPAWFTRVIKVKGITMLSHSQFQAYKDQIRSCESAWWLLDTVDNGRSLWHYQVKADLTCELIDAKNNNPHMVRPLLVLENNSYLSAGDQIKVGSVFFHLISDKLALCDTAMFSGRYRNEEDKLSMLQGLEKWLQEQHSAYKLTQMEDCYLFGRYRQGSAGEIMPIKWHVIHSEKDKALLLSRNILEVKAYDEKCSDWQNSSLRKWLNEEFYEAAFSEEEKARIIPVNIDGKDGINSDKVSLLTSREADELEKHIRPCENSVYVIAKSKYKNSGNHWWCRDRSVGSLRFMGKDCRIHETYYYVETVKYDAKTGKYVPLEEPVIMSFGGRKGVRPAVWIRTDS